MVHKMAAKKSASKKTVKKTTTKKATPDKAEPVKKKVTKKVASKVVASKAVDAPKPAAKPAAKKAATKPVAKPAVVKPAAANTVSAKPAAKAPRAPKISAAIAPAVPAPAPVPVARVEPPAPPAPPSAPIVIEVKAPAQQHHHHQQQQQRRDEQPRQNHGHQQHQAQTPDQPNNGQQPQQGGGQDHGNGMPGEGGGKRRRRRRRRRRGGGGGDANNPQGQQGAQHNGQQQQQQQQQGGGQQQGGNQQQRQQHGGGQHNQQQRQNQHQQRNPQQQQQHNQQRRGPAPNAAEDEGDNYDGPDDDFDGDDDTDEGGSPNPQNGQQNGQQAPEPPPFECQGILEWTGNAEGRIRQFGDGLIENSNDPWVPLALAQQYTLRHAQRIVAEAVLRKPKRKRRGPRQTRATVTRIISIEGIPPEEYAKRKSFADFTALDPQPRLSLEYKGCPPSCRLIDLFCPIGFGTRGLIVAPPKAGKTMLLQNIAYGIKRNHPQVELVALLIDERPEEVTDFKRNVPAHVLASSNDQDLERHLSLGILAIERAKRMVEAGKDVVVLLDSLTRLGRAFNNSRRYGSSGRTMSGGVDSRALEVPKQLFGAARKCEEGGSLTIIATCLVDTGSRADQVIFEEFKGTGNMELILDRSISEKRIFPAINLAASGTRKEHLLMPDREFKTVTALRRRLMAVPPHAQIEQLLAACQRFESNELMVGGAS